MESALIISNTTPLINFAEIGRMDVLQDLFGTVVIPPAVATELDAKSELFPKAAVVPAMPGISLIAPADHLLVKGLGGSTAPRRGRVPGAGDGASGIAPAAR